MRIKRKRTVLGVIAVALATTAALLGVQLASAGVKANSGIDWESEAVQDGGAIDPTTPEALVYAPNAAGKPKLAALEYIMFASEWPGGINDPPTLFDKQFFYNPAPNRFGLPAFWALHVWLWEPNPSGMFQPWNPRVSC